MSRILCDQCGHEVYKQTKYMDWLTIMNFINFLSMEGYIEQATAEDMIDRLMSFKEYALDESDVD